MLRRLGGLSTCSVRDIRTGEALGKSVSDTGMLSPFLVRERLLPAGPLPLLLAWGEAPATACSTASKCWSVAVAALSLSVLSAVLGWAGEARAGVVGAAAEA